MNRYLCGILIISLVFLSPQLKAEESSLNESNKLIINEVMTGSEVNPDKDVWIELFNPGDTPVDLSGWQIKGVTKGGRWIDIYNEESPTVEASGYFLISYYTNSSYSALSVKPDLQKSSLAFPNNPIEIELKNAEGVVIDQIIIDILESEQNTAYERDTEGNWSMATSQTNIKEGLMATYGSPKAENSPAEIPEEKVDEPVSDNDEEEEEENIIEETIIWYPTHELISEFMVNPEGKDTEGEWIELFNPTQDAIDLGGWFLDDSEENSRPFRLRDNTWIGAGSYKVFSEPELKLSLKNSEDRVRLLDPNKSPKEVIHYQDAKEGWSYAKNPKGEFKWTPHLSPGSGNIFPEPPKSYLPKSIEWISALPNPKGEDEGNERLTLKNNLGDAIDLSNWKIRNKKGKEYPLKEIKINVLETIELNTETIGFSLTNKEDTAQLIDPSGNVIDEISWVKANDDQTIYPNHFFTSRMNAKVTDIIDGDTVKALINDIEFTIRLIGVDAPESVHPTKPIEPFGIEAKEFLSNQIINQNVKLEFEDGKFDSYNRLLAYIYVGNILVNESIIENGLATAYLNYPFSKSDQFKSKEIEAQNNRLNIWSSEEKKPPKTEERLEGISKEIIEIEENKVIKDITVIEKVEECPSEGLSIMQIMPNAQKGISQEYIVIKNDSGQRICLEGWQLDDGINSGSKPFSIRGGAISPNGVRRFRKSETKLSLNNKNDCANLINPKGDVVDRICYSSTHKNEVFTHAGGDWLPKTKKASSKKIAQPKVKKQSSDAYKWELIDESVEGEIVFIYEEGKIFYVKKRTRRSPFPTPTATLI